MNGSPSSVLTMGFGSWGSTGLVLTLGYGMAAAAIVQAGRLEYTAEESRIEWRAEPALMAFTAEESRVDWRAER